MVAFVVDMQSCDAEIYCTVPEQITTNPEVSPRTAVTTASAEPGFPRNVQLKSLFSQRILISHFSALVMNTFQEASKQVWFSGRRHYVKDTCELTTKGPRPLGGNIEHNNTWAPWYIQYMLKPRATWKAQCFCTAESVVGTVT